MPMLHSFSSPVRATRSPFRDRPELNLTITYVTDCGTSKDHPSSGLQDGSHLPVASVQILFCNALHTYRSGWVRGHV